MKQTVEEAARIEREKVILELHDAYRIHKDPKHYVTSSALIQKRPFLYNVGQVFKACDWLTEIQRGNIVWHRYHLFGTITKRYV